MAFSGNSSLAKHKQIHTGEKQCECDICKKAFALRNVLPVHKWIHTGKSHMCVRFVKAFLFQ